MRVHPRFLVGPAELAVLGWYSAWRGGMAPGPLPWTGGWAEQPAAILEAFAELADVEAELAEKPQEHGA